MTQIYTASGGTLDFDAARIDKAVRAYDENLRFGFNPENQDYILYVVMPRSFDSHYRIEGEPVYPIIGFGKEMPTEDHVITRLQAADVRKRGIDVYRALLKHNRELTRKQEEVAAATVGEAAARIEHLCRSLGMTEKYGQVAMHIPKKKRRR